MADPVRVGSIGDWSHNELSRVIRREIDRNTKKHRSDPNVTLTALLDVTIQYDSDDNGTGSLIVKSGPDAVFTIANNGYITIERGADPSFFATTIGSDQHRFFSFYNSIASANAAGIKVGGLLVSDNYGLASPAAGYLRVQHDASIDGNIGVTGTSSLNGTVSTNALTSTTITAAGGITTQGASAALIMSDRGGSGVNWYLYPSIVTDTSQRGFRIFNTTDGDLGYVHKSENLSGLTIRGAASATPGSLLLYPGSGGILQNVYYDGTGWEGYTHSAAGAMMLMQGGQGTMYARAANTNTLVGFAAWNNGAAAFDVLGSIHYASASVSSDARFKKNIKDIPSVLDQIKKLRPVEFEWNEKYAQLGRDKDYETGERFHGFIAQEVADVFPTFVRSWMHTHFDPSTDEENEREGPFYGIDYERFSVILVKAVQELSARVEELERTK